MRTPAQQATARANGARSSMDALSLHLLAKATIVKNESCESFQELLRQHTLRIAPRDAIEETCSASQSSPDGLECLPHACGALAGKYPRLQALRQPGEKNMSKRTQRGTPPLSRPLGRPAGRTVRRSLYPCAQNIIRRSLARIQALRQPGARKHDKTNPARHASVQPPAGPAGGADGAPEPLSMHLRPHIPVPRTSAREPQKPPPPPSRGNPRRTHGNPRKPQENPRKTRHPGGTAASSGRCVPGSKPGRNGGARCVRTHRPVPLHTSQACPQDLLGRSQRQPPQIRVGGTHTRPNHRTRTRIARLRGPGRPGARAIANPRPARPPAALTAHPPGVAMVRMNEAHPPCRSARPNNAGFPAFEFCVDIHGKCESAARTHGPALSKY
jgi:hypothetical protein